MVIYIFMCVCVCVFVFAYEKRRLAIHSSTDGNYKLSIATKINKN